MSGDEQELTAEEQAKLDAEIEAWRAKLDARIQENNDGTMIVDLACAVDFDGVALTRVTVRTVKVRDIRARNRAADDEQGHMIAELLTAPSGVYDELRSELDMSAVYRAADRQLGKYQTAGDDS